jgi:S1-C subfamily serine protease
MPVAANVEPFIGATFLEVGPVIADQFDLLHPGGVLVDRVYALTPAHEAGLKRGDIIMRVNGRRINDIAGFKKALAAKKIGKKFKMDLLSNGARKSIKLRTIAPPAFMPRPPINNALKEVGWLGSEIGPLTAAVQPYVKTGVYVTDADGVLRAAGVQKGDVIKAINNNAITDMRTFMTIKSRLNVQNGLLLDIIRGGNPMYITVRG